MVPAASWFALLALCTVSSARVITYNQTQVGRRNIQVDLEKVLILVVPPSNFFRTASSIFDFGKSGSTSLVPKSQDKESLESHHEVSKEIVEIKQQSVSVPPVPDVPPASVVTDETSELADIALVPVVPAVPAAEKAVAPADPADSSGVLEQIVAAVLEPLFAAVTSSRGRSAAIG